MKNFSIELSESTIEILSAIKKKEKSDESQENRADKLIKELRNQKGRHENK